jgi:hypothetical protein
MRKGILPVLLCAVGAFCALPAMGQGAGAPRTPPAVQKAPPPKGAPAQVSQKPYTANFLITQTRTPATGAPVTHEEKELIARDTQGRRVTATTPVAAPGAPAAVTHVNMSDPVARTNSSWSIPGDKVTVTAMPQPGARTNCGPPKEHAPAPKPTVEQLGKQTIMGIETEGRRITATIPASANGKEPERTRITEEWTATDPGLRGFVARESTNEAPTSQSSRELQNFREGEPNPAFFQVPAGYQVVNKPVPGSNCPANEGAPSQFAPIAAPPPA